MWTEVIGRGSVGVQVAFPAGRVADWWGGICDGLGGAPSMVGGGGENSGADVELPGLSVVMPACDNMISGAMAMMGEMLTSVCFAYHERGLTELARWEQSECDVRRHPRHDDGACLVEVVRLRLQAMFLLL